VCLIGLVDWTPNEAVVLGSVLARFLGSSRRLPSTHHNWRPVARKVALVGPRRGPSTAQ